MKYAVTYHWDEVRLLLGEVEGTELESCGVMITGESAEAVDED